ncbi:MAG: outer membrane lipoprotein chaperone LolA [Deltaproteobacteria bacterium]|nr:outer membrane lipoprotein chaperone LolA [Deltaproteobacteria bacterium]
MVCFFAVLSMAALAADVDGIVAGLQAKYETVNSLGADFTQEVFSKSAKKPFTSTGKVFFKKPGKMRWQYAGENKGAEPPEGAQPLQDELISDGKTVWFFQSDLNQVMERKADSSMSGISTDFLSGIGSLKKDFNVKLASSTTDAHRLELTPKQPQPNVKRIFITLDMKTGIIVKTSVEDPLGTVTEVSFRNVKLNVSVKDSFFEFGAPKGVSVIKQ